MHLLPTIIRQWLARPVVALVAGFAGAALLGAVVLMLIGAPTGGLPPVAALFTATSAVCVTGLIVVDTATQLSLAGQITVLVLIQLGGLGVMAFAALVFRFLGRQLSIRSRVVIQDAFWQRDATDEFKRLFLPIALIVIIAEGIGAVALWLVLPAPDGPLQAAWVAVFHSISAFCNAGFSLWTDNLAHHAGHVPAITIVSLLIIAGGLGHIVVLELAGRVRMRWQRWRGTRKGRLPAMSLHARIVLVVSLALIGIGALALWLTELATGPGGPASDPGHALFQSISARTAGFNTVDIAGLGTTGLLVLTGLMIIGGSPGSCAGGIKTTTFAIWLAWVRARSRSRNEVVIADREVPIGQVHRALLLVSLVVIWTAIGLWILLLLEPQMAMRDLLFEQISAFATVGLTTGITGQLGEPAQLWLILTMFVGRLGPLTILLGVVAPSRAAVRWPEGKVMIG